MKSWYWGSSLVLLWNRLSEKNITRNKQTTARSPSTPRLICSTFLPHLPCAEMFWQAVKNQNPLLSNAIYLWGSCTERSGWVQGLCQGAEQFPSKGCLSRRANAAREAFCSLWTRTGEEWGELTVRAAERALGKRCHTKCNTNGRQPAYSFISSIFLSVAVFLHPVKLFDLFPSVQYRSLLQFT